MPIITKRCVECHITFYCGCLTCNNQIIEADHSGCYCVKCSLKSDNEGLISNVTLCPKSKTYKEAVYKTALQAL